ncbi:MAG: tripartite tricarboxylate transporter substrate binding protein [Burkholderiales bacterium]|nr:tripartite tricarboxylate transporter substrate binding protein [Burkholderiales bacterium]
MQAKLGVLRSVIGAGSIVLCVPAAPAAEAAYPTRPVRMIVPFVAGGGTDLLARLISPRLGETLAQQIVIDNRGGAGSVLGTQLLAKAPADGYTLGMMDTAFAINPSLVEKLAYDAERDFTFVAIIATSPSLLITHPGLKVRSIQELIAAAKKRPGKITAGSAGVGSSSHLSTEMLKAAAGIDLLHVPFKGAGAAIVDLLSGHTDLTFVVPGSVLQHIQAGTLVPLAITGKKPPAALPNVPTFASVGLGAVNPEAFRFIAAPSGIPGAVQKRLAGSLATVMAAQDLQTRLTDNGFDPEFLTDQDARAFVTKELRKWRQVVKQAGVKLN